MNQQSTLSSIAEPDSTPLGSSPIASKSASAPFQQPASKGGNAAQEENQPETESPSLVERGPASRCAHLFPSGRRCRRLPHGSGTGSRFCLRHTQVSDDLQPDDLTPYLTGDPTLLDTFEGLHLFLEHLAVLVVRNRISTRRASVLAFITSQIRQTLSAVRKEEAAALTQIIFDAPRPIYD